VSANKSPSAVIVLGPFRSGTSLVTNLLSRLGLYLGPEQALFSPTLHNMDGYYQRADITRLNTRFIQSAGYAVDDPGYPEKLIAKGDAEILKSAPLEWTSASPLWGMKDPRFCITLLAWLEAGIIKKDQLRLVHIRRNIDNMVNSALKHYDVKHYCRQDRHFARNLINHYDTLARWHVDELAVPTLDMSYEDLLSNPLGEVGRMADFMGVQDDKLIHSTARYVGKRNAFLRYLCTETKRILSGRKKLL
jgi:hypothetical protein